MKQQKLIVSKNKYKILPNELFVDIFKAINTLPFEIINWKIEINNNNYSNIIIQKLFKYWWNKYVKNILNSSSIIYINISKAFLKRMLHIKRFLFSPFNLNFSFRINFNFLHFLSRMKLNQF
ncbi:hypothetical protein Mgra_00001639 [Meloidogyne graminicola]|uniref:Uncharacterized protein n=1 Tax=Meloidogyne graminicola TaxID=189291 RepID=A0A8S9ZYR7_9BILA|nr:hypothetical protein Mgra_00001639 [Meloidogyne graminicola]